MIYLALKLDSFSKVADDPLQITNLVGELSGTGMFSSINNISLEKYTWFALLGLSALMFICSIIHIISTCKSSKCLLGLGTFLLILVKAADIAGLVYMLKAQNSIDENLTASLNNTIVNMYGNPDFPKVTEDWNFLQRNQTCCGIINSDDYQYAKHWSGDIIAGEAPCLGGVLTIGCLDEVSKLVTISQLFITIIVSAKATLIGITLFATFCACGFSFNKSDDDDDSVEAYDLMEKSPRRRHR